MEWTTFSLGGRECFWGLWGDPQGDAPLVLWPTGEGDALDQGAAVLREAAALGPLPGFVLAGWLSEDWNRDFSPWPAPALFRKAGDFAGQGPESLTFLRESLVPELLSRTPVSPDPAHHGLLGYSLAGLFSLWAFLLDGAAGRCACCSGSLWYDGWEAFAAEHRGDFGDRIYLSLGRAEEKARNSRMARVGEATRQTAEALGIPAIHWQEGGHFDQVSRRLAEGLRFLVAP